MTLREHMSIRTSTFWCDVHHWHILSYFFFKNDINVQTMQLWFWWRKHAISDFLKKVFSNLFLVA